MSPKYPWVFPIISIIPNFSFIILTKTIGTGINWIGQAKLKIKVLKLTDCAAAQTICAVASRTTPIFVRVTNCATSDDLCDQIDQLCGRTLGNFGQKLRNWGTFVLMTIFNIIQSKLSVFKQNNNPVCTLRLYWNKELINNLNIPILPLLVIFHFLTTNFVLKVLIL